MRTYSVSRLALLLVAGFLVVASQVWTGGTLEWLFIVGGSTLELSTERVVHELSVRPAERPQAVRS